MKAIESIPSSKLNSSEGTFRSYAMLLYSSPENHENHHRKLKEKHKTVYHDGDPFDTSF